MTSASRRPAPLSWLLAPLARTPLGGAILGRGPTEAPVARPTRLPPGDPEAGRALVGGSLRLAGHAVDMDRSWGPEAEAPGPWRREAHGFGWLDDLAALGGSDAANRAVALTQGWLDAFAAPRDPVWRGGATGDRLAAWVYHWDGLFAGADPAFREALLTAIGRQTRHLRLIGLPREEGPDRLFAAIGLATACACLPAFAQALPAALDGLVGELDRQILPDGGHAGRDPSVQARVLARLAALRRGLSDARVEPPLGLIRAIDRMAPMLRFFRHGDGGLAQFNGAGESDGALIDLILAAADARGRAPARAPHAGYERLKAGKTLILCDAGPAAPPGFDAAGHAGALSFEMSIGKDRLIVNCGHRPSSDPVWLNAMKATAAHSTLGVADTNSSALASDGLGFDARRAKATAERNEADGASWLDMGHDGYFPGFGLLHRRRLYLAEGGEDLRGEDRLEGPAGQPFAIRFHLHPRVSVSLIGSRTAALLKTPGGGVWRFRAGSAEIGLEDSLYFGLPGEPKRTQQIVLSGLSAPDRTIVKWALQAEQG